MGQTIKAVVVATLASDRFLLNINNQNIHAQSNTPLTPGDVVHLKVVSLNPKPTMEILGKHAHPPLLKELLPPMITLSEDPDQQVINELFENISDVIEAKVINISDGKIKLQLGNRTVVEGTISNQEIAGKNIKLKLLSLYPKPVLEVLTSPQADHSRFLSEYLNTYSDIREATLVGVRTPGESEKNPVVSGSNASKVRQLFLEKSEGWHRVLKDSIKEYLPANRESTSDKSQAAIKPDNMKALVQEINNILGTNKQFIVPLLIPTSEGFGRADIIISNCAEKEAKGRDCKNQYSALICLNTDILGSLEIRITLDHNGISASIKGNKEHVINLITESLPELKEQLEGEGMRVGFLNTSCEKETISFRDLLARELKVTKNKLSRMDIIA